MADIGYYLDNFTELPEPKYKMEWVKCANIMKIHSQGANPKDVLITRHTHEDPTCFEWRLRNYVPITTTVYKRAVSTLTRILNDSEYAVDGITYISPYLNQNNFYGFSFFLFIQNVVIPFMLEEPNGYIAWMPEIDEYNKYIFKPVLVQCSHVYQSNSDVFIYESHEKSWVTVGKNDVLEGLVYYVFSKNDIIRTYQVGEKHTKTFVSELIYTHNMNTIPAFVMGGDYSTKGYYDSFFSCFVPFGNEVLKQYSDWTAVLATCAFPIREITPLICNEKGCDDGKITHRDGTTKDCHKCNGSGYYFPSGPFSTIQRPEKNPMGGGIDTTYPTINYIAPPVEIIKYAQESWQLLLEEAEKSLNMKNIMQVQSGIAKSYDREEQYAMISRISSNVYDNIIYNSLNILNMYFVTGEVTQVAKPVSFKIKSEEDLQKDYSTYINVNGSKSFAIATLIDLTDKKFIGSGKEKKITKVLALYDPLYLEHFDVILSKFNAGIVTLFDVKRNTYAYNTMINIIKEMGEEWFEVAEYTQIFKLLTEKINNIQNGNIQSNDKT